MFISEFIFEPFKKERKIMTVLITSQKVAVIIEPDRKNEKEAKRMIKKLHLKKIAIVNICCMNTQFHQIRELINNKALLKIFHGGTVKIFNDMLEVFQLAGRNDFRYVVKLEISKIMIFYWKHHFGIFPPTISKSARGGLSNEEI